MKVWRKSAFEVVFSDSYILERDAQLLLDRSINHGEGATYHADLFPSESDLANPASESAAPSETIQPSPTSAGTSEFESFDAGDGSEQVSETFEIVNMASSRYLCSIPVLAPPPAPNQTATELAKLEEAKELSRASVRGVELVNGLAGECMYYISGWWSYSFCYGKEVVQFHALTAKTGKPVKDPHSQEYILGRMLEDAEHARQTQKSRKMNDLDVQKPHGDDAGHNNDQYGTELQVKGDQRYMVQHLGAGTICDLTNRERTIEVQYHCNPGGTSDRISWIKEVTTCSYLMEVRTPRLCEEIAFRPPKPTRAHPINCRLIVGSEEEAPKRDEKMIEAAVAAEVASLLVKDESKNRAQGRHTLADHSGKGSLGLVVGGITVGARQALGRGHDGHAPMKLEPPQRLVSGPGSNDGHAIRVIAKGAKRAEGGQVEVITNAELAELNFNPETIENLAETVHSIAEGKAWKLEAFETPGQDKYDIRATIEPDEAEVSNDGNQAGGDSISENEPEYEGAMDDRSEGSKETFKKDEL
ncbi:misfolded glycoproteins degradation protein [Grosmannia clavigera kw1407]|uniref:Endoplasmic reticulum lectin n=1 Tax=Grosmannia clavigera (strain kw1407 / UAMH 11150) TaxID=655863 RepID=F0X7U5_GROCL|nr:misfolded glycoproteins degradation protein [Grosmannia clavigera kw1407]EFX06512.1 misfolded glycoproteins degradation protein [Grosmannia clavigera kw1407]